MTTRQKLQVWSLAIVALCVLVIQLGPETVVRPDNSMGLFGVPPAPEGAGAAPVDAADEDHPVDAQRDTSTNEVSVAAHPTEPGVVLAAMHDFAENSDGPAVVTYRSIDGGTTYVRTGVFLPKVAGVWTADPSVAFDRKGHAYLAFLQGVVMGSDGTYSGGGLYVARSKDGGQTWRSPRLAVRSVDQGVCVGPDKPYIGIGPARPGLRDTIYLSWQEHQSTDESCSDFAAGTIVKVARSTDGGHSFSTPVAISELDELAFGSMPRVTPDGIVRVTFLLPGGSGCTRHPDLSMRVALATSRDGGRSFSRSIVGGFCAASLISNGAVIAANSIPILDVSPAGHLAVAWVAGESETDNRLEVSVSSNGKHWQRVPDLDTGPVAATLQEWIAYGPDERLHVMHLAAMPSGAYDVHVSSWEGRSWAQPVKLTSQPSLGAGVYPGFGLGHYPGFDVGPDGVGHAMWTDARGLPAMYRQDVWTRSIRL